MDGSGRDTNLGLALALALALVAASLAPLPARAQSACPTPTAEEAEVVERINLERAGNGLSPVQIDGRLMAAAVRHSEDMRDGCFLSHTGSDGSTARSRMRDAGYPAGGSEAAGAGQTTPAQIVQGWMGSTPHRAILLNANARHVGVGHAVGPALCVLQPYGVTVQPHWWTADFGNASEAPVEPGSCEEPEPPACDNGLDDDGDGYTDFLGDFNCSSADDPSEAPDCSDGIDNDGDGLVDHPDDPGCAAPEQWSESNAHCGLGFELALLLPPLAALRARRRRA